MKIAMIGKGNVGTALSTGWRRAGHDIRFGHRDPKEPVHEVAEWGEIVVFAVPFTAVPNVIGEVGSAADGKVLIDVTNAVGPEMELAIGFTTSSAEEIQKGLPRARVLKPSIRYLHKTRAPRRWTESSYQHSSPGMTRRQNGSSCSSQQI